MRDLQGFKNLEGLDSMGEGDPQGFGNLEGLNAENAVKKLK